MMILSRKFLFFVFFLILPALVKSDEPKKTTYTTILNHRDIGYCSTDGKNSYSFKKYHDRAFLDRECFKKNYDYANSSFNIEEVLEGDYEFYDNCVDSVKIENKSVKTGKINYKYQYTCTLNKSYAVKEFMESIPLKKFEEYNGNKVSFTDHSQIKPSQNPCNIITEQAYNVYDSHKTVQDDWLEKGKNKSLSNGKIKIKYIANVYNYLKKNNFKSTFFERFVTPREMFNLICFQAFASGIVIYKPAGTVQNGGDFESIRKEGRFTYYDEVLWKTVPRPFNWGRKDDLAQVFTKKVDCDDSLKKSEIVKYKSRRFYFDKNNQIELSKSDLAGYVKIHKKLNAEQDRLFDGLHSATELIRHNMICQIANGQSIRDAYINNRLDLILLYEYVHFYYDSEEGKQSMEKYHKFKFEENEKLLKEIDPNYKPMTYEWSLENFNDAWGYTSSQYIQKNVQAHDYYGRVNNSFSDPGMQQAILNLNHAQYYFLKALDEDEAAIVSQKFVEALQQGAALGRDDLQKILTQTRQQQLLINKKIKEGHILKVGAKQTFSEGIQYYSKGVMILTLQGFSAYDIFNVISSDSNIFVRILSGFSLFLKIKDSLFAIPLFLSSTADILSYASQNDIQDIEELQKAKDSIGI